jgi:hypothetical protein
MMFGMGIFRGGRSGAEGGADGWLAVGWALAGVGAAGNDLGGRGPGSGLDDRDAEGRIMENA